MRRNYWQNICDLQRRQTKKGIETYGMRLEDNQQPDIIDRLTYLEEELIDGLMYVEWIKSWIGEIK